MILNKLSLQELQRLKERWQKATIKDENTRRASIEKIDMLIAHRQNPKNRLRCALPKKRQREWCMLPPVNCIGQVGASGSTVHLNDVSLGKTKSPIFVTDGKTV